MDNDAEFPDDSSWIQPPSDIAHQHNLLHDVVPVDEDGNLIEDDEDEVDEGMEAVLHVLTGDEGTEELAGQWQEDDLAVTELETLRNNLKQSKQREEDLLKIHNKALKYLDDDRKQFWARACVAMCVNYAPELAMTAADDLLKGYDKRFVNKSEPGKDGERKLDL